MNGHPDSGNEGGHCLKLEQVRKTYPMGGGAVQALDGVDWSVGRGSFWAVMGPSGSGKSTLLNIVGCLDRPTSGRYFLEGHEVSRLDDSALSEQRLRRLGFIFQSFNLIAQLTVLENIELPLYYQGANARDSRTRALEMADLVGLGDRVGHRPSELSGGQQQRVAIARALSGNPSILLADEPTGNLDSTTSVQIMSLLSDLNRRGKTIIMVTHESDIAAFASRRLHMLDGRIAGVE
jgi:putative ABC transport system ATP-binding protein